jgi:hypothetical protein
MASLKAEWESQQDELDRLESQGRLDDDQLTRDRAAVSESRRAWDKDGR